MHTTTRSVIAAAAGMLLLIAGCSRSGGDGKKTFDQESKTINGMKVTFVHITGTYLSPGGPMMQSQGEKPGYRLLGAIVEGPQGSVFFKMTGPDKTVRAAKDDFNGMISSVKPQETEQPGTAGVAGIAWTVPGRWTDEGSHGMRAASYAVPATQGDTEGAECAVFYFGNQQGGSVEANIDRWKSQFKDDKAS